MGDLCFREVLQNKNDYVKLSKRLSISKIANFDIEIFARVKILKI